MACVFVPTIQISPAPPQEHVPEVYSPFNNISFPEPDTDASRPSLLTPTPNHTTFAKHLSPLCPPDAPVTGRGLERERFEALLRASKERNALIGAKKAVDLRKEIALKAHKNKQVERRALFLSKVLAPPSPTATVTPKTPPESPAVFHYSLPSPGLVSPLALFDSLHDDNDHARFACQPWVEQVDFRLPNDSKKQSIRSSPTNKAIQALPSLDQISARLRTLAPAHPTTIVDGLRSTAVPPPSVLTTKPATIEVGRLRMPLRASKPTTASPASVLRLPTHSQRHIRTVTPPPKSSDSTDLQVTTTVVPRTASAAQVQLTEANLKVLNAREHRAHNMLSTLRRRTLSTPQEVHVQAVPPTDTVAPASLTKNAARRTTTLPLPEGILELSIDDRKSKWKRHSAPAELMPRERIGFEHPILSLPGAF